MRQKGLLVAMALWCASGLYGQQATSTDAERYLNAALDIMQEHFLYRTQVDWPNFRKQALAQAEGAQTAVDTYPAIRFALAKLGDHHSYLQLTPDLTRQESARAPKLVAPGLMPTPLVRKPSFPYPSPFRTRRVPEGGIVTNAPRPVAQVVVPQFASSDRSEVDAFATSIQRIIHDLLASQPCGWILDLRGNGGGNVWAMRAGVGPLLGDGEHGSTLNADGHRDIWFYQDGKAGVRGEPDEPYYARTTDPPVKLAVPPPVAVLIDRETGSSGEGVAVAFEKRSDTRFFGELTYGAATSTFPYPLSDGAQIYLVTGAMLDREGNAYLSGIPPDVEILSEATITTSDPVVAGATRWLVSTTPCVRR